MAHRQTQEQRFLQKMSLTPQMRQSIQILGMPIKDLVEYVDSVSTENPFLKKLITKPSGRTRQRSDAGNYDGELAAQHKDRIRHTEDPRQTILSQIRMSGLADKEMEIAEHLVYEMDENGYITTDSEEIAGDLSVETDDVEKCLEIIQAMEPAGIGAHDVRECLQLQLKRMNKEDSLEYAIVTGFVHELAQVDVEAISSALKTDTAKVRAAINNIKKLNPRPASTIFARDAEMITPELIAHIKDRHIRLELNRSLIPNLKLYNPYENDLNIVKDPEARQFLKENLNAAKSLLDNLKRREDTVCKVASYILNFQKDAIIKQGHDIKSLTIKDLAKALDFHPSTISRAISNKYIQIEDKVMPLNSLLSHAMKKSNGEITSKTAVKRRIVKMIKDEDRVFPISDIKIADILRNDGIFIQRRTVAKYRQSLRILPAHFRKRSG